MIPRSELERRLGITVRALSSIAHAKRPLRGVTAERAAAALEDLRVVSGAGTLGRAYQHLADHQAGYPTTSMSPPTGRGGISDRTGETVAAPYKDPDDDSDRARHEPVTSVLADLDECSARLERDALALLAGNEPHSAARRIEEDASRVRWILKRWSREPDVRWCSHCWDTNRHREPVALGKYRDLCRPCGDWRRVNKKLPPKDVLPYLQTRKPVPQRVMAKHRAKLPRPVKTRQRLP